MWEWGHLQRVWQKQEDRLPEQGAIPLVQGVFLGRPQAKSEKEGGSGAGISRAHSAQSGGEAEKGRRHIHDKPAVSPIHAWATFVPPPNTSVSSTHAKFIHKR